MPWLLRSGEVLATAEIATSRRARRRGLLGRDGVDGALLIEPTRSIHTVGMRFPIDVAYCRRVGEELEVLEVCSMRRWRIGAPRLRASCVIEAEMGAFERWRLTRGDVLEIK
ncbi:MAG TPA: DUF192 domain-containing protein [Acidimicrobiia bacterium]|jgi:uncharacterized membrane protein (UPF0127 family)|nr:DUF192 domain-containing protein [Acidimicrobiia bacterium]